MGVISNVVRQVREGRGTPLALCRMRLDFAGNDARRATNVVFDLSLGNDAVSSVTVSAVDIGVPVRYSEARLMRDPVYRFPEKLLHAVRLGLPAEQPLYLVFDSPYGYLPAVPWEKLATPALGRPILRLGATAVRPVLREQTMDVAYCCSLPANSGISPAVVVTEFIRQLPRELPRQARLHVFTHRNLTGLLERKINSLGLSQAVMVYTPPEVTVCPVAGGSDTLSDMPDVSQIQNPWLLWMRDVLQRISIDGVHFVCMGYLGRSKSGLRLSETPMQSNEYRCAEIVSTRELAMFLQQVGAWAVAFSSPPFNSSDLGLRMLFHEISGMVAGPTAMHDIAADSNANALGMLYRYVFSPQSAAVPSSPALALATHPGWQGAANQQWDDRMERLVREYTLFGHASTAPGVASEHAAPSWVTSQQRGMEKSIAELAKAPESASDQAREDGILEALKFTTNLIAKYAGRHKNDDKEPGGGATS